MKFNTNKKYYEYERLWLELARYNPYIVDKIPHI